MDNTFQIEAEKTYTSKYAHKTIKDLNYIYTKMVSSERKNSTNKLAAQKELYRSLLLPVFNYGNKAQEGWAIEKIYDDAKNLLAFFIKKYSTLTDTEHFEDLMSELKIQLIILMKKYDPYKSSISEYINKHMLGAINAFKAEEIYNTTPYYGSKISQLLKHMSDTSEQFDIDKLSEASGFSKKLTSTLTNLIIRKDHVSIDDYLYWETTAENYSRYQQDPLDICINDETFQTIFDVLSDPIERQVFIARVFPEKILKKEVKLHNVFLLYKEIADLMNMTIHEIKNIYKRAHKKLYIYLKEISG